jgi:hypothetical protein
MTEERPICCICRKPFEYGEARHVRFAFDSFTGETTSTKEWHHDCGPIDMVFETW